MHQFKQKGYSVNRILLILLTTFILVGCNATQEIAPPNEDEISQRIEQNKIDAQEAQKKYESNKREKPASF
jgi:uncharacterized protein YcfL